MRFRKALPFILIGVLFSFPVSLNAQGPGQLSNGLPVSTEAPSKAAPEGIESGGYRVQQSVELGYRITDIFGSVPMYDTLVNLQQGPRIFEQSLSMQSMTHEEFFDTLTANSFGWG